MSIEENLDRIASALEHLAFGAQAPEPGTTRAMEHASNGSVTDEPVAPPAADEPVTREGVQAALTAFVTDGPGKAQAKDVLGEFKAGSISTLDEADYAAFVARLAAVAAA